jgi:hypothetical protein
MTAPQHALPPIFWIEALFSVLNISLSDILFPFAYKFFYQCNQILDKDGCGHVLFHGAPLQTAAALTQQLVYGTENRTFAHRHSFLIIDISILGYASLNIYYIDIQYHLNGLIFFLSG